MVVERSPEQKIRLIIADDDKDVNSLLAATFVLKGYEVYKTFSADECLSTLNELGGKVDVIALLHNSLGF